MSDLDNIFGQMQWQDLSSVMTATELTGGSDEIAPKRVSFVIKEGTPAQLIREHDAYLLIMKGNQHAAPFFPRFSYFCEDPNRAVLALEDIPGITLEDVILNLARASAERGITHAQTLVEQDALEHFIVETTETVRILGWSVQKKEIHKLTIVEELCDVLAENLERAELPTIKLNARTIAQRWKRPKFCVSHRDLSVGNIMCHERSIRLIDPRLSIPHSTNGSSAIGTPLIDSLMLLISLERKQAEIETICPGLIINGIGHLRRLISELKEEVPAVIVHLITAVTYAMYAACKCDYCLAPERVDLYNAMVEKTKRSVALLQETVR